jgi:hypothetical protein
MSARRVGPGETETLRPPSVTIDPIESMIFDPSTLAPTCRGQAHALRTWAEDPSRPAAQRSLDRSRELTEPPTAWISGLKPFGTWPICMPGFTSVSDWRCPHVFQDPARGTRPMWKSEMWELGSPPT